MNDFLSPLIEVKDLHKSLSGISILSGISFDFLPKKLYVIIGRSGSGKSTFLRCLNGLETLDHGKINVSGSIIEQDRANPKDQKRLEREAHLVRLKVGMVFQQFNLFPHLNLLQNLTKAQQVVKHTPEEEAVSIAEKFLTKVGLMGFKERFPQNLSGGQQQRAAIARTLCLSPLAILYDEPTSALDPEKVDEVLQIMKDLDQERMTQIVVTHEMRFARDAADMVLFLDQGKIAEFGDAETIFSQPKEESTRQYLRKFL